MFVSMKSLEAIDWNNLSWNEAQRIVVEFLHSHGYMSFHESQNKEGRADGYAIRKTEKEIIKVIVEVKHYKKITDITVKRAIAQGLKYMDTVISKDNKSRKRLVKPIRYVVVVVFTKDYPVKNIKPIETREKVEVIYCSGKSLEKKLKEYKLIDNQKRLDEFF